MSHHIYQTEGYVIGASASGEAGLYVKIYTRDLGLIHAIAQGVRYMKSKLRYSLQEYSHTKLSLVRGKEVWRITNAKIESNLFYVFRDQPEMLAVVIQSLHVLDRLVRGEEEHGELFETLHEAFLFFERTTLSGPEARLAEYALALKILSRLGYGTGSPKLVDIIRSSWSMKLISDTKPVKFEIATHIRNSLHESHL